MNGYMERRKARKEARAQEAQTKPGKTVIDLTEVENLMAEIECCLAEHVDVRDANVRAGKVDDETAAATAFDLLLETFYSTEMTPDEMRGAGDILKAKYGHTRYVQQQRCCHCGCPWNEAE